LTKYNQADHGDAKRPGNALEITFGCTTRKISSLYLLEKPYLQKIFESIETDQKNFRIDMLLEKIFESIETDRKKFSNRSKRIEKNFRIDMLLEKNHKQSR